MHIGKKNWSILLILSIVSHALPLQADNIKADSLIQKAKLVRHSNCSPSNRPIPDVPRRCSPTE